MTEIDAIRTKIVSAEAKLAKVETKLAGAETAGDRERVLVYENKVIEYINYLTKLQETENLLSAGSGNLLSYL